MALTAEGKAVNTALVAYVTAVKAWVDAGTAADVMQMVPLDLGTDATVNKDIAATAVGDLNTMGTGPLPSFSTIHSWNLVDDGEYPIAAPGTLERKNYLFWAVTNGAHDLDLT